MSRYTAEWNHGKRHYNLWSALVADFGFMFYSITELKQKGRCVGLKTTVGENWWLVITCENEESAKNALSKITPRERKDCTRTVNRDLRTLLRNERISYTLLAAKLKMDYGSFRRLLLRDLLPEERDRVLAAVDAICTERANSPAERTISAIMKREGISKKELAACMGITEEALKYARMLPAKRPSIISAILTIIDERSASEPMDPIERTQHWGIPIYDVCVRLGIGTGTYYKWCADGHREDVNEAIDEVLEYRRRYRVYD